MKNPQTLVVILFSVLCVFWSSCQKVSEESVTDSTQLLKIKPRSSGNVQIDYPLYLYAFDGNGTCSASQIIRQAGDTISLKLAPGEYRIVAFSGVSGGYIIPDKPNALEEITLQSTYGATTPMMMGKADVTIGKKATTLNITLTYAVTVVSVALNGVPDEVSAVQLTLSPMYGALCMNGEYSNESYKIEIPCKQETGSKWAADSVYAFPGSGNQTVFSILVTQKDNTQTTYAYTYQGKPEANRPFNVSGNYTGSVMVGGEILVEGWGTPIDVEFDFGTTSNDNTNNNPSDGGDIQVGKIWNNGIVVENKEGTVLLMSLGEWQCYSKELAETLEEHAVDGWLLPNESQARLLNSTFQGESLTALNETLEAEGYDIINVDKRYLYDNEGEVYAFGFKPTSKFLAAGTQTKYRVRLVKAVANAAN